MATELTAREEIFCQKLIELKGNKSEAYRSAYNARNMTSNTLHVKASLLAKKDKVRIRLDELKNKHQQKHEVTVESLAAELEEARDLAKKIEAPAPMVAATKVKAQLYGMLTEKHEVTGRGGEPIEIDATVRSENLEDVARFFAFVFAQAAAEPTKQIEKK